MERPYVIDQMISAKSIAARIEELCEAIHAEFSGTDKLVVVGLLRGSFVFIADLVISFKVFRERFGSRVVLFDAERRLDTEYLDGPFKYMKSTWAFEDTAEGCEVKFFVDFEFKNALLQGIIGVVFNEAMQRVVRAFERRADALYGG